MTDKTWLQEQQAALRLTDIEITRLNLAGYHEREDFAHVTADQLIADTEGGLKRPAVVRVLVAAGVLGTTPTTTTTASSTMKVVIDTPDRVETLRKLLRELSGPGRVAAIADLRRHSLTHAVVDPDGSVDEDGTLELLAAPATALHAIGAWWGDKPIVPVDEVGKPRVLHHPRTGVPLNKANDPVGWCGLTRDQLVVAAAIYIEGLDAGDSERVVLLMVKTDDKPAMQARTRLAGSATLVHRAEARIDRGNEVLIFDKPVRDGLPERVNTASRLGTLSVFLLGVFSSDELRRFVRYLYPDAAPTLPGVNVSHAELVGAVVDLAERRGWLFTTDVWRALLAERPRRSDDIITIARSYGVTL